MGPIHTSTILLVTIALVAEGALYLQPESADVIVDRFVTFECGTHEKANPSLPLTPHLVQLLSSPVAPLRPLQVVGQK